jgi:hypothetical protein
VTRGSRVDCDVECGEVREVAVRGVGGGEGDREGWKGGERRQGGGGGVGGVGAVRYGGVRSG